MSNIRKALVVANEALAAIDTRGWRVGGVQWVGSMYGIYPALESGLDVPIYNRNGVPAQRGTLRALFSVGELTGYSRNVEFLRFEGFNDLESEENYKHVENGMFIIL